MINNNIKFFTTLGKGWTHSGKEKDEVIQSGIDAIHKSLASDSTALPNRELIETALKRINHYKGKYTNGEQDNLLKEVEKTLKTAQKVSSVQISFNHVLDELSKSELDPESVQTAFSELEGSAAELKSTEKKIAISQEKLFKVLQNLTKIEKKTRRDYGDIVAKVSQLTTNIDQQKVITIVDQLEAQASNVATGISWLVSSTLSFLTPEVPVKPKSPILSHEKIGEITDFLFEELDRRGANNEEGIFRQSAKVKEKEELLRKLETEPDIKTIDLTFCTSIHSIAVSLKQIWAKNPIFDRKAIDKLKKANSKKELITEMPKIIEGLPEESKKNLHNLLKKLKEYEANQTKNLMNSQALGVVWAISLFSQSEDPMIMMSEATELPNLVQYMLDNYDKLGFDSTIRL